MPATITIDVAGAVRAQIVYEEISRDGTVNMIALGHVDGPQGHEVFQIADGKRIAVDLGPLPPAAPAPEVQPAPGAV